MVNQTFCAIFSERIPIGQQILLRYDPYPVDQPRPRQIVGVVGDVKHRDLGRETFPFVYASYLQQPAVFPAELPRAFACESGFTHVAERPAGLVASVKQVIANIDPDQPISTSGPWKR